MVYVFNLCMHKITAAWNYAHYTKMYEINKKMLRLIFNVYNKTKGSAKSF